jgi:trehalose 6-phosphate synthase
MPIDLKIYENFHDAVARYKHFDLLMVNSLFDGMNLVAKEAPAVNTRDGVLMLSENTGSHEELYDYVLTVNPFDIQEQADAIYRALTMPAAERREWSEGLKEIIYSRNPGDWVDDQLRDIEQLREAAG